MFLGLVFASNLFSQKDYCTWELQNLSDITRLPQYREDRLAQLSSYDRTGGNDDGFSGRYSYQYKEGDDFVIADLKGKGVINRIWTPTPSKDTVQFYFDGETQPRINMPFIDLFSGSVFPFVAPLCGNEIGGYFCYLPIPYEKSLKIIYKGEGLKFHQIQYRELSSVTEVKSFSSTSMMRSAIDKVKESWSGVNLKSIYKERLKLKDSNFTIKKGETKELLNICRGGGRIVGIELLANHHLYDECKNLVIKAKWDDENSNALELPLASLFGFINGDPSMRSMLLGADSDKCYSYLPMPFDSSASISIEYCGDDAEKEIPIVAKVYYTTQKRNQLAEGKLYAQSRREYLPPSGKPYTIADIKGKGHYIGTILIAQGLNEGMTEFWESDDCSFVDGDLRMHGTGSEDYFNGGWYAVMDRWDRGISLPIHGSLHYDIKTARTGGYRFYLSDKINFDSSYMLTIEHGPEGNKLNVDYTSVGLFYADAPQYANHNVAHIDNEVLRRDILLPQDMTMRLYWFTQAFFDGQSMIVSAKREDHWTTNIDFEAVPMVQFDLTGMDNGKYRVYIVHTPTNESKPFSIWQRTKQISEWISAKNHVQTTSYVGEMEITDQIKTLTLRKKKMDDNILQIDYFIFEKVKQ